MSNLGAQLINNNEDDTAVGVMSKKTAKGVFLCSIVLISVCLVIVGFLLLMIKRKQRTQRRALNGWICLGVGVLVMIVGILLGWISYREQSYSQDVVDFILDTKMN
jgi:hypothetical protein